MSLLSEFKSFAVKGNAIDLAVGVIIGAAFGKIVESLVNDITMPLIARLIGGKFDFSNLFFVLGEVPAGTATTLDALRKAGVPVFAWGLSLIYISPCRRAYACGIVWGLDRYKQKKQ